MLNWKELENKRICVAISGGEDSVALLHYMKALQKSRSFTLLAVHCEHGIRGEESIADMRFVEELCAAWGLPLFVFSADCPKRAKEEKISLETAARTFRRECFTSLFKEDKIDYIATAHHRLDEAETVLFRLARGASLSGLAAMQRQNGRYLRPILSWSKEKISAYIAENGLEYRVDSTNLQTEYTRNKLRLEVLPKLEEAVAGATKNIARFATLAAEDDELLYRWSYPLLQEGTDGVTVLFSDEKPLFTRACLTALKRLGVEKDYTSAHLSSLFALQGAERGALLTLPKGVRAQKTETGVAFSLEEEELPPPTAKEESVGEKGFDGGRYAVKISYEAPKEDSSPWKTLRIDEGKLPKTAVFRFRKEGDRIRRFGGGQKSLKKFFNEEKIPPKERAHLPLIADGNEVYVVCGVEISELVKIDENTRRASYISIRRKEE